MDKLEYIPGDLVMVKESALQFAKDKTFKVISSSLISGFVKVVMLNDSSTTYSISNNVNRPIPLTTEILKKNGWELLDCGFYISPNKKGINVYLPDRFDYPNHSAYSAYATVLRSEIYTVSDLQHLLFGLGLNSEMEV